MVNLLDVFRYVWVAYYSLSLMSKMFQEFPGTHSIKFFRGSHGGVNPTLVLERDILTDSEADVVVKTSRQTILKMLLSKKIS